MSSPSIYVVSAICGNFLYESGCNPQRHEGGTSFTDLTDVSQYGGYGLGQWTNKEYPAPHPPLTRRRDLVLWLRSNGYTDYSGDGECAYVLAENHWSVNYGPYQNLTEFLESPSTDINELAYIWFRNWEGINDGTEETRKQYARDAYDHITRHAIDPNITDWVHDVGRIPWVDSLNNCVMVYRFYIGYVPPTPPTPTESTRSMPVWMMIRPALY